MNNMANSILRKSTTVFSLLVTAKFLNLIKKILVGKLFGISTLADVFFAASYLPYCAAVFFEGVIYLGLLPLFGKTMREKGSEEANRFLGNALPAVMILTSGLAAFAWLCAPWLVHELVPGFKLAQLGLTVDLFRIMILVIVFISMCSFFQALNSYYGHYAVAGASGLTDSLVMIGIMLVSYRAWGIFGAAWASVISAACALSFQIVPLLRIPNGLPGKLSLQPKVIMQILSILIPMCAIWGLKQVPIVILNRFGSGMWQGTISAYAISLGLMIVPTALVSQTVLICIFPSLAKQAAEPTADAAQKTFSETLRAAFFILIPLGFMLSGFARPIAVIFFSGGGITDEGTRRIANSLSFFGWAAFVFYADIFFTQFLITSRRIMTALMGGALRAVLTYGLGYYLSALLDYKGLALSFSLALAVNFFVVFPVLFRHILSRNVWKNLLIFSFKMILSACPALLFAAFFSRFPIISWLEIPRWLVVLAATLLLALCSSIMVFILSRLKIDEFFSVRETLSSIWGKRYALQSGDALERSVNADVFNDENL